jgi:hypothetical protein
MVGNLVGNTAKISPKVWNQLFGFTVKVMVGVAVGFDSALGGAASCCCGSWA